MCFQRTESRPYVSLYDCPALPFDVFALLALTQNCSFSILYNTTIRRETCNGDSLWPCQFDAEKDSRSCGQSPTNFASIFANARTQCFVTPYTCFELLRPHMCHHTLATCTVEHVHDIHVPAHVACKLGCGRSLSVSVALRLRSWRLYAFRKLH